MTTDEPLPRQKSSLLARNREAVKAAEPFNDAVASWQPQLARLRVLANRPGKSPDQRSELSEEAEILARQIYDQQLALSAARQLMPSELATHSRIADTHKAMNSASAGVEVILAILAAPQS